MELNSNLIIGALLHDFGKLMHRYNDGRDHGTSGYDHLKDVLQNNKEILNQIKYHHYKKMKNVKLDENSLAYITYIADNIASAADRRKTNEEGIGFSRDIPLQSIFNLLNGKSEKKLNYKPLTLTNEMNTPTDKEIKFTTKYYGDCVDNITDSLRGISLDVHYINSLIEVLEGNLSFIPSSTNLEEVADISLFDHSKITAGLADSIYKYLSYHNINDYKSKLFKYEDSKKFYEEKAFILYSIDLSGIQDFIYNIESNNALKMLRIRSFYLEILVENLIDNLLEKLGHSRANLIYLGGGHGYVLTANTPQIIDILSEFENESNLWLLRTFKTQIYVSGGYAKCSANDLQNKENGSYKNIFKTLSNSISDKKMSRYTATQIIALNNQDFSQSQRECSSCFKTENLSENNKCTLCNALINFSQKIVNDDFFMVMSNGDYKNTLPLPIDKWLVSSTKNNAKNNITSDDYIRSYCKNEMFTGHKLSSKIWVGDYKNGKDFEDFTLDDEGIKRIGVLRADVDNLGKAFVSGFENEKDKEYYVTLSRTATFSRKLSIFFKRHINGILENGCYNLTDDGDTKRKATIVYSGGDDVFIVGLWSDIIGFAVDLNDHLKEFTQEKLTISAGIGIFPVKHPISSMAREVGNLEEYAKNNANKNSIALFDKNNVYTWDEFINEVLNDKYYVIRDFFNTQEDFGNSFIYKVVDLLRNREEKINIARLLYFVKRMEPNEKADEKTKEAYSKFSINLFKWIKTEKDSKQAITAIYIYVYTKRRKDDKNGN